MARILFVDDEPLIREEAVQVLLRDGHKVVQASDGREAIKMFETVPVDIVILDIVMPNQDGLETIAQIREHDDDAKNVKIIAISSGGHLKKRSAYLEWAKSFGADRVLPKPFSLPELRAAVKEILADPSMPTA
jgi:DNA-binding response OmpR family regulator